MAPLFFAVLFICSFPPHNLLHARLLPEYHLLFVLFPLCVCANACVGGFLLTFSFHLFLIRVSLVTEGFVFRRYKICYIGGIKVDYEVHSYNDFFLAFITYLWVVCKDYVNSVQFYLCSATSQQQLPEAALWPLIQIQGAIVQWQPLVSLSKQIVTAVTAVTAVTDDCTSSGLSCSWKAENNFGTRASPGFHLAQLGIVSAFLIELPAVHLLI